MLLIAGGGLNSLMANLPRSPIDPNAEFSNEFRCVYADLRNAINGESTGPLEADRPWDAYTDDHIGLMDHLGIDKFMVLGFCIGGPFIWNILERAPSRVAAAVIVQPVGFRPESPNVMYDASLNGWGAELVKRRPDITQETVQRFVTKMFRTDADFVFTVSRDFVRTLYAWHPIPVIEIASSGHIDGAGIFFFLLSILFLQSAVQAPKNISFRKEQGFIFFSGFLFGFAALVKLYPFFLAPVFLVMVKRLKRILFSMGLILSIAVLTIPFTPDLYNILNTLGIYLKNWEFSNFAFRTLRDVTSSGDVSRLILAISFLCIVLFFTMSLWKNRVKEYESGCSLNTSGIEQFGNGLASKNMFLRFLKGIYLINFAILLLSPTLYPWYVIGLVCLIPLIAGPAGIIFSWSVFLSYYIVIYYVYLGQWLENSIIPALIWCGPALSVLMTTYLRYHYRHKKHVIVEK